MIIELPKEKSVITRLDPRIFILYSQPKCGKTTLLSHLPNNLFLDFEGGTDYVESLSIHIIGISAPVNEPTETKEERLSKRRMYLMEAGAAIMSQGRPYKFVTVDTVNVLEDMVLPLANEKYRNSPMGANWGKLSNGSIDPQADVRQLARGGGYYYLRLAFEETLNRIKKLADNIILVGHLRSSIVEKNGEEVSSKELSLTGKIREITCAEADAIGYMYRGPQNELIINFKSSEEILCGARPPHLKGKEIKVADYNETTNELINIRWDLIYPDTITNN